MTGLYLSKLRAANLQTAFLIGPEVYSAYHHILWFGLHAERLTLKVKVTGSIPGEVNLGAISGNVVGWGVTNVGKMTFQFD